MASTKKNDPRVSAQIAAIQAGSTEEKIEMLIEIGVLTKDRKLAKRYKSGATKVSRTEVTTNTRAAARK